MDGSYKALCHALLFDVVHPVAEQPSPFNHCTSTTSLVNVDEIKLAGKKQNINPTWKILMKDLDVGERTSFLDHVYLGCTRRECQISKEIVDNYRNMFESRISAGATDKLPETKATGKPDAETISSWSYDMEGHARKCVEIERSRNAMHG